MFDKTPINPELVNSIEQVYLLRTIALQLFSDQGWQQLNVDTEVERARSIVAFVDVLKRAGRLDRVLILSMQSNVLHQIQRSFELHTDYSSSNLWIERDQEAIKDISLASYEQLIDLYGLNHLAQALDQFQLIILDEADHERNRVLIRRLQNYPHWVLKVDVIKPEALFIS